MIHNFYQIGGGEHTVFENEKQLLVEHGHYVITYTRDNAELKDSLIKKLLLPFSTTFSLKTYREVKRIIRKDGIDIVHCHNTFPLISPSVYYAAWRCKTPVIQTIHNFRFLCANGVFSRDNEVCEDCIKKGLRCGIKNKCYRKSRLQTTVLVNMLRIHRLLGTYKKLHYIFLTEFNKSKFRILLGNNCEKQFVKPNFEFFEEDAVCERDKSFVYVGRLDKNKGIDFVIDNWDVYFDLYIFGSGELEDYVKEACERNDKIHYMGFQTKSTVKKYLQKAIAMVFPSDMYEGFPMTIVESFAVGTPVVCSDIGNGAAIVNAENAGIAFPRRDREGFLKAISIIERDFSTYSANAKNAYKNNYNPEKNYRQLVSIYDAVKNESR